MKAHLLFAFIAAAFAATDFEKQCAPKAEVGFCKAKLPRWWFNADSGKCEQFYYGGCGGNANKYLTKEKCEKTCSPQTVKQAPLMAFSNKIAKISGFGGGVCSKPRYTGPCKARIPRFYYDTSSKSCRQFYYGGCHSNGNNFVTLQDCERACGGRAHVGPRPR
uniref:Putative kunitz-type serine protease inhibitor 6 n=1 Tax=Amblyomma triste TaxID=251400 RepID=A0A023GMJ4_AMBTT